MNKIIKRIIALKVLEIKYHVGLIGNKYSYQESVPTSKSLESIKLHLSCGVNLEQINLAPQ